MKNSRLILCSLFAAATVALSGCHNDKTINGANYQTFGIANEESQRDPKIVYEISAGSVICAIIFSETLVVPVYVVGWDLWQPAKAK